MANDSILALIEAEIARLTQVRTLLASTGKVSTKQIERNAQKAAASVKTNNKKPAKAKTRAKRVLSSEARARIAEAQRKRWAAQKSKKDA